MGTLSLSKLGMTFLLVAVSIAVIWRVAALKAAVTGIPNPLAGS